MSNARQRWRVLGLMSGLLVMISTLAQAHCSPLQVSVIDNRLTVTSNLTDPIGFANQIFLDAGSDCAFEPAPQDRLITDSPAFQVTGTAVGTTLLLQPILRETAWPLDGPSSRWFWYWDPATQSLPLSPNAPPLQLRSLLGHGTVELFDNADPAAGAVQLAEVQSVDLGQHRHWLRYQFNNVTTAPPGAFGFFAQLTSPSYDASEPFLVILNSQLDATALETAALTINAATGSSDLNGDGQHDCADIDALIGAINSPAPSLAYDLNGDGQVSAADMETWLVRAGAARLPSQAAIPRGDANLNGVVNGQDFVAWNGNKFTATASWCAGDFDGNGLVNGGDFVLWNANKFSAGDRGLAETQSVPEPWQTVPLWLLLALRRRRFGRV